MLYSKTLHAIFNVVNLKNRSNKDNKIVAAVHLTR